MKKNNIRQWAAVMMALLLAIVWTGCDKKPTALGNVSDAPNVEEKAGKEEAPKVSDATVKDESKAGEQEVEETKTKAEDAKSEAKDAAVAQTAQAGGKTPVYMGMWGNCGGTSFLFDMNGLKGSYIPYNTATGKEYGERRQLELVSYNPKTGHCVINAFLNGKYIGQFDGTFNEEEVDKGDGDLFTLQAYGGKFKSVKGGSLDFSFYFD